MRSPKLNTTPNITKIEITTIFEEDPQINLKFELILSERPLGQLLLPLIQQKVLVSFHWLEHVKHIQVERQAGNLLSSHRNPAVLVTGNSAQCIDNNACEVEITYDNKVELPEERQLGKGARCLPISF